MNVFLSYAAKDRALALEVRNGLLDCGHRAWSDEEIGAGESLSDAIARALKTADAFIVLLTENYSASEWALVEVGAALASGKPVIPVLAYRTAETPSLLQDLRRVDLTDPEERGIGIARLCEAVEQKTVRQPGREGIEVFRGASAALEHERLMYEEQSRLRYAEWRRVQLLAAVVAMIAAVAALVTSSLAGKAEIVAVVSSLSAVLASIVGFYLGSHRDRERP